MRKSPGPWLRWQVIAAGKPGLLAAGLLLVCETACCGRGLQAPGPSGPPCATSKATGAKSTR